MRSIFLLVLALLISCKKELPVPSVAAASAPSPTPSTAAAPVPNQTTASIPVNEPTQFFPEFGLVLFGSCILVDTNGLGYPIQGPTEMLSQELTLAEVGTEALRPEWQDLIGKSFTIYSPTGENRQVVIQSFRVLSIVNDGADAFREIWEEHPDHQLSETEFRQLQTAHLLVAVFDEIDPTASSPSSLSDGTRLEWARLSSLGEPKLGKAIDHDAPFHSRIDRFITQLPEYVGIQERYRTYVQDQKNQEEGKKHLPATWIKHAKIGKAYFQVGDREIGFVSLASRSLCEENGFDADMTALVWTSNLELLDLSFFPSSITDEKRLMFAWDNESKGNLDLLFTDGLEWISFVRVLPDGTTRSFALHIPYESLGC